MSDGGKGSGPRPYSISQTQFADNWDAIFGKKKKELVQEKPDCYCFNCLKDYTEPGSVFPYVSTRMILCPDCGNKRCPHATDHLFSCTGSNNPGQTGSRYE